MRKSLAGHVTKTMNYHFLTQNFALKLQGKCWKDDVVTFIAHLNVIIKHLTRYKQKVVFAAKLEGKNMPPTWPPIQYNTLLENQSTIKYLLSMRFLSNFGCKIILMCSVDFWQQQDYNSLREALVTWPLSASGLFFPTDLSQALASKIWADKGTYAFFG